AGGGIDVELVFHALDIDTTAGHGIQVSDSDAGYLDAVAGRGRDVEGVENQLVSAAHTACNPDDELTVLAVAGQLIEQGRTDKDVEEVVTLINERAQAAYC